MQTSPPPLLGPVRIKHGLTQQDLATRTGISQGAISAFESGRSQLTTEVTETLSSALGARPQLLQQPAPEPAVYQRLQSSLPAKSVNRSLADLSLAHFHVGRLLGVASSDLPSSEPGASAGDHARAVRRAWGVPRGPVTNMIRLLEEHGVICLWRDTSQIHTGALGSWTQGAHPVILLGRQLTARAARVELARELGRAVLHSHPLGTDDDAVMDFADEFLLPERDVVWSRAGAIDRARLGALEEEWGVPPVTLLRAAHQAGAISKTHRRMLNSVVLDIGTEAAPVARERPRALLDAIRRQAAASSGGFEAVAASALIDLPDLQREYLADAG